MYNNARVCMYVHVHQDIYDDEYLYGMLGLYRETNKQTHTHTCTVTAHVQAHARQMQCIASK